MTANTIRRRYCGYNNNTVSVRAVGYGYGCAFGTALGQAQKRWYAALYRDRRGRRHSRCVVGNGAMNDVGARRDFAIITNCLLRSLVYN